MNEALFDRIAMTERPQRELRQERLDISPFQRRLGLKVESTGDGSIEIGLDWRAESKVTSAETSIAGPDGKLVASGRGVYRMG